MSWQQYVDQSLLGTGCVTRAAIHSLDDGKVWATSPGFSVLPREVDVLRKGYANPEDLYSSGLHVAATRYVFLRRSGEALYGRKGSGTGVCICKTNKTLIIGYYEGGIQPGPCNAVVEKLGDYLREQRF